MIINEFLPNPVGKDTDGEFIELFNDSQNEINLTGWQLKDASGKSFVLKNQKLGPAEYLVFDYKTTKISLNNGDETLFLYDQKGVLVDKAGFTGNALEGKSVIRKNNKFVFTDKPTPGKTNVFENAALSESAASKNNLVANIANAPINNLPINNKASTHFTNLLIGLSLALILAFLSVIILKKLNLSSD